MVIIPAVDIKGGKCVRLEQGVMEKETVFSDNPEEMALEWQEKGAERLHVVDLDGAVQGKPCNMKAIKSLRDKMSIPVQLGGGIRNLDTIKEYVDMGIDRVIIGTIAYKNSSLVREACREFPGRILVSIDSRDGYVSVEGWTRNTDISSLDLARRFEGMGVSSFIFTDVKRDGMSKGPNIEAIGVFASGVSLPVMAAGGFSDINDIKRLLPLEEHGVEGLIIGRALYDGSIRLEEAIEIERG